MTNKRENSENVMRFDFPLEDVYGHESEDDSSRA